MLGHLENAGHALLYSVVLLCEVGTHFLSVAERGNLNMDARFLLITVSARRLNFPKASKQAVISRGTAIVSSFPIV